MTSHIEKIQALGNRMVTNLSKMGVSAEFEDGGLTLADKILQIQKFTEGLFLKGNSSIIQSGDSVKLSAMLLKDNNFVSQAPVEFYLHGGICFEDNGVTNDYYHDDWLGLSFLNVTVGANGTEIENRQSSTQYMLANKINTPKSEDSFDDYDDYEPGDVLSFEIVSIEGDVDLYVNNEFIPIESPGKQTVEITESNSYIGFKISSGATFTYKNFKVVGEGIIAVVNTNDSGIASATYVGEGCGVLDFYAKSGSFVSKTYDVLDTLFYDTGVTGTPQTGYIVQDNRVSKQVTDDGTVVSYVSENYGHVFIKASNPTFQAPFKIEFDLVSYNGEDYLNIMDSDGEARIRLNRTGHYEITVPLNQNITATCDGNPVTVNPNNLIPNLARLSFFVIRTGSTITFKELKIYPI